MRKCLELKKISDTIDYVIFEILSKKAKEIIF